MLNQLRIIPAIEVMTFETPCREHLLETASEIEHEGRLKNPLLVKPIDDSYLLLDDITVLAALEKLGVAYLPAQLADETKLTVRPWQRVVENWTRDEVVRFCQLFPRKIRFQANKKGRLDTRQAEIRFRDRSSIRLTFVADDLSVRLDLYNKFFTAFIGRYKSFRAKFDHTNQDPLAAFPNATAAIYPPSFSIEELTQIARRRLHLPYGLVRIDQPGRILGIDYALSILREDVPLQEKQAFLSELIRMRMATDRTAYYDGYIYVFNG